MIENADRFYIDGQWATPSTGSTFAVVTPSTEELFERVAEAFEPDIERAVNAARMTFDQGPWATMTPTRRAGFIKAIGDILMVQTPQVARDWSCEMGIVLPAAEGVSGWAASVYGTYAALAESFEFERPMPQHSGNFGLLVREPVGVVAAIIPWNAPPLLIAYKVAPALLAGCTVVLKASPEAPSAAYAVAAAAHRAGLPAGVLNVLTADRAASEALVRNPAVDKVTFTGSSVAGKRIASICGERIARCTLELGGKSAAVVLDDADLDQVADAMAGNATLMTGQVCAALTRIVVTRKHHDNLVDAIAARLREVAVGDPLMQGTQMGPLAMSRQRDRVENYIASGKAEGAQLVCGGGRPTHLDRGFFVEPTLFSNVSNRMTIAREEIFGPVLSVIPAEDEEALVAIANDSDFGLSGGVFTPDADRAYRFARRMRTGTVGQNGEALDFFNIAFGGFKQSGIGREGGVEGLMPFLETKAVVLAAAPSHLA
jgi:acyl-CoA reductase-like NAD-dependent aldehyde dehydrogenase